MKSTLNVVVKCNYSCISDIDVTTESTRSAAESVRQTIISANEEMGRQVFEIGLSAKDD